MHSSEIYSRTLNLVGVSHKTLGVAERELLTKFAGSELEQFLSSLTSSCNLEEAVVISTCNRFEVVGVGAAEIEQSLVGFFTKSLPSGVSGESIYNFRNTGAVRHLFEVTSSLDSMVLGENQILKQVKDSYAAAVKCGYAGKYLHHLFQDAFRVAKRVRTDTGISKNGISISYIAVRLAEQIFGDLSDRSVLIIGSGEMAELAALHFRAKGCSRITVANRTLLNALNVARLVGGSAASLDELPELLRQADIVIGSISVEKPIITPQQLKQVAPRKDVFLIDLGVPRNFSSELNELEGVYLYNIDDLDSVVKQNVELRKEAMADASLIVQQGILRFEKWLVRLIEQPRVIDLRETVKKVCEDEFAKLHLEGENLVLDSAAQQKLQHKITRRLSHELRPLVEERIEAGEEE